MKASPKGDRVVERLAELGHELPALRTPSGNYKGYNLATGPLLFLSGQGAEPWFGKVGAELTPEEGREAARDCMLNLLAQARDALGSLDRIRRVVKLLAFVNCTDDFIQLPKVVDGASDLLIELLGEKGRHGRTAMGSHMLPLNFAVEIEMILEVDLEEKGESDV